MGISWLKRALFSYEGVVFTLMFALIFILTNMIMVDFLNLQSHTTSQDPFFILMLAAILAYLFKNSSIELSRTRIIFLTVWSLYIISMFISMVVAGHFVWTEAAVLLLISVMFFFRVPKALVLYLILGGLLSLPSLLLADYTLNESGATLVFAFTAGLLFMPKANKAMIFYVLPTFALLLVITTSRTAILSYIIILVLQLAYINLYQTSKYQRKRFIMTLSAAALIPLIIFIRPVGRFFTAGAITGGGIQWNTLTSGRYELWARVFHNRQWFGEGHSYFDFTELLHAHNILFDTLGRYGIITAVLFIIILAMIFVLSILSIKTVHIAMYMLAFIIIGMFEYSYLFMFTYFLPIILFFALTNYLITYHEQSKHTQNSQVR